MSLEKLESLVNGALDNIADLPDYTKLPLGSYILVGEKVGLEEVGEKKTGCLKLHFNLKEVVELGPDRTAPKIGDKVSFQYSDDFGIQKFKKVFLNVIQEMNCTSIAQFMDKFEGMEFVVAVKERKDKKDETKVYAEIQTIVLA